jgi:3'-phosphoadenosine 5'-phosphosulfate sulfotransferase (PAPS reductase)/FAD synthetase
VRFEVVRRAQNDLLDHVRARGKWPGSETRYCTSDHKTKPVAVLMTRLVNEAIERLRLTDTGNVRSRPYRRVRILNCLGLRAEESPKRRDMQPVSVDPASNETRREVTRWLPIHAWSEQQVWALIRAKGLEYHRAYDLGMPRLSCVFCFYAPPKALLLAGYHNRGLLAKYVAVEREIGHAFQFDKAKGAEPLVNIQTALEAGYVPAGKIDASAWSQCA